jgi:hypothetical protein
MIRENIQIAILFHFAMARQTIDLIFSYNFRLFDTIGRRHSILLKKLSLQKPPQKKERHRRREI